MALVVEDGTGTDPAANSYASVQEWKSYWVERGYDFSAYTDSQISVALIKATFYIEVTFRNQFYGFPLLVDQPLCWPRVGVYVNGVYVEGIHINLKRATFEYAKRALPATADLLPDPADTDATGQIVKRKRTEVGPIKKEIEYAGSGAPLMKRYPAADKWLEDFKPSGGGTIRA